ncbi:hypothetical protein MUK42_30139 [Musa troglodytarum]|uniref:Uncharacterized protein n=1 Tax=Musa troglodytarum TaxID=320322 RepID=A0A9E7GFR8_9LILI|nr:hypothetical protein MUK42_30139 [Musa troglodytarum]
MDPKDTAQPKKAFLFGFIGFILKSTPSPNSSFVWPHTLIKSRPPLSSYLSCLRLPSAEMAKFDIVNRKLALFFDTESYVRSKSLLIIRQHTISNSMMPKLYTSALTVIGTFLCHSGARKKPKATNAVTNPVTIAKKAHKILIDSSFFIRVLPVGPLVPTTLINITDESDVSLRAYFRGNFCFEQLPSLNSAASQLQSVKHASLQASTVPRGNGTVWLLLVKLQIRLSFSNSRVAETLPLGFKIGIIDDEVTGVKHGGSRYTYLKIGDKSVFFVLLHEQKSLLG